MPLPFVDEQTLVVAGGEFVVSFYVGIEMINGACAGGAAAGTEFGKARGCGVGISDKSGLRGRQFFCASVVWRQVERLLRIEWVAGLFGFKIIGAVCAVESNDEGPPEI